MNDWNQIFSKYPLFVQWQKLFSSDLISNGNIFLIRDDRAKLLLPSVSIFDLIILYLCISSQMMRDMKFIYVIFVLCFRIGSSVGYDDLEVYRMSDFPKSKVALHMPCEESNMFATKWSAY
jgi:hypothetical protein